MMAALTPSGASSGLPQAPLGEPVNDVYGASPSSLASGIVSGRARASRACRIEVRTSLVCMFCTAWRYGDVAMPAPRLVAVDDRVGEGGVGALAPPGDEVKEIFRGVTVGSA